MTTADPSIETRGAGPVPAARGWATLGWFSATIGAVYVLGLNRNLLYLSLLLALGAMLSPCITRLWAVMTGLAFCAYLAVVSVAVPDLGKLYPAPRDIPGADRIWCWPIPEGETWTYRFKLEGLGRYPGAIGRLYVDGRNLTGLSVGIGARTFRAAAFTSSKEGMDHVSIPMEGAPSEAVTVTLRGTAPQLPRIFRGTEVHGLTAYGDAVWLEFSREKDRIIYEAKRSAATSGPPPAPP